MNQTLTQIQEEFDEKFKSTMEAYDLEFGPWDGTSLGDDIKSFLTQSNLRVLEKVREIVESKKLRHGVVYDKFSPEADLAIYNTALDDVLSDFPTLIEQK